VLLPWLNNRIKETEEAHRRNETRKFYKAIKMFKTTEQARTLLLCKDDKGKVLTEKQRVLERWKHYFNETLNRELTPEHANSEHEAENLNEEVEIPPPTYNEVSNIIKKLRNNKVPGPGNIISELIQEGGRKLKHRIYMLILKIWEKEEIPADWENSIICLIYKKRVRMQCKNYRPITLLNVAYKIFATILCNRLSEIMEGKMGEYQMGFRPNRSTVNNTFILCQMCEKCYEYNIELHDAFIDFNQAYDSINRCTVIKVLKEMQIPEKIVSLVNMVMQHTKAKIKLNNEYTEQIEVKNGIKQGDPYQQ